MAEYLIANSMQPMRQFFVLIYKWRRDPLPQSQDLQPVVAFTTRIAMANAYETDFLAPMATGAILASTRYQVNGSRRQEQGDYQL